jgi:hypothetical protein
MSFTRADLVDAVQELALASGAVANFCDHAEHNECTDIEEVRWAARVLRSTAIRLSRKAGCDPVELYADRLAAIEARNVLYAEGSLNGAAAAREATGLRALQLVQAEHDRAYHADVVGLTKSEQLRHYALHLAKLVGETARAVREEASRSDWLQRRVADMLLFGLKLSTVTAERLPEEPLERCDPQLVVAKLAA